MQRQWKGVKKRIQKLKMKIIEIFGNENYYCTHTCIHKERERQMWSNETQSCVSLFYRFFLSFFLFNKYIIIYYIYRVIMLNTENMDEQKFNLNTQKQKQLYAGIKKMKEKWNEMKWSVNSSPSSLTWWSIVLFWIF